MNKWRESRARLGAYLGVAILVVGTTACSDQSAKRQGQLSQHVSAPLEREFSDANGDQWFSGYAEFLKDRGLVSTLPGNSFQPHDSITRAQFCNLISRSRGLNSGDKYAAQFPDVTNAHPLASAIASLANKGWIVGYPGGAFMPDRQITTAEMYTIASKAVPSTALTEEETRSILSNFQDGDQVPIWAESSVALALRNGTYVSEKTPGKINSARRVSQAEAAAVAAKLANENYRTPVAVAESHRAGGTL